MVPGNDWAFVNDEENWNERIIFGTDAFQVLQVATGLPSNGTIPQDHIATIWPWLDYVNSNLPLHLNTDTVWQINTNVTPRIQFEDSQPLALMSGQNNANELRMIERGSASTVLLVWFFGTDGVEGVSSVFIPYSDTSMGK